MTFMQRVVTSKHFVSLCAAIVCGVLIVSISLSSYAQMLAVKRLNPPESEESKRIEQEMKAKVEEEAQRVNKIIDEETAKITPKPQSIVLPSENAAKAVLLLKQDNFAAADELVRHVYADSKMQAWRFHPFTAFMQSLPKNVDEDYLKKLNAWDSKSEKSPWPYLLRAEYYYDIGITKRGTRFFSEIQKQNARQFEQYIDLAKQDISMALHWDNHNPYAHLLRMKIYSYGGGGARSELKSLFLDSIKLFPDYYWLYSIQFRVLSPKWGGSVEAMYDFVETYAGKTPANSPLRLLYVRLYANLIDTAYTHCVSLDKQDAELQECLKTTAADVIKPELQRQAYEALQLYKSHDAQQFNLALEGILADVVGVLDLSDRYSLVSLTSNVMNASKYPNYVLDKKEAESLLFEKKYEDAVKKYQHAIDIVSRTKFADEADKYEALSELYDGMTLAYDDLTHYNASNFINMIVAQNAASRLSGRPDASFFKCYAYYRLNQYERSAAECTKVLALGEDYKARYWRATVNELSGYEPQSTKLAEALEDYKIVANSEDYFRTLAALKVSDIYIGAYWSDRYIPEKEQGLNVLELNIAFLRKHPFLFDERTQRKQDVAKAYVNLCSSYWNLNKYEAALYNCEQALRLDPENHEAQDGKKHLPESIKRQKKEEKRKRWRKFLGLD